MVETSKTYFMIEPPDESEGQVDGLLTAVIGCESGTITIRTSTGWLLWSNHKRYGATVGDMVKEATINYTRAFG